MATCSASAASAYKMHWFEMAARVLLLVHAPAQLSAAPHRRFGIHLLPTLVGGGRRPGRSTPAAEGRSLLPHLSDGSGHDEVIGEYTAEGPQPADDDPPRRLQVHLPEQDPPLYRPAQRPAGARRNFAASPAYRGTFEAFDEARRRWDIPAITRAVLDSQRRRRSGLPRWREGGWPAGTTSRGSTPASSTCATIST